MFFSAATFTQPVNPLPSVPPLIDESYGYVRGTEKDGSFSRAALVNKDIKCDEIFEIPTNFKQPVYAPTKFSSSFGQV
jgi:hypothetical protein